MDPITSAALTDSYKRQLNQSTVKSKNMLILNSPKIQSNLNDFIALWGFNSASVESWTQENCVYEDVTLCLLSCQDSMCLHSCSHAVFCFGFVCCCCPPPSRVKPRWSVPSSHRCLYPIKHILKVTEGCAGLLEYSGRILFIIYAGRSILELSIYLKWSPSTNRPYL